MRNTLILMLTALMLCATAPSVAQQGAVPDTVERAALMAFYENMNGASWGQAYGWRPSRINSYPDSIAYLRGVTRINGDITMLSFQSAGGMTGILPPEVNNLHELQTLQIRGAHLGTLPPLGNLGKLATLDLTGTTTPSAAYPAWLFKLKNLRTLILAGNSFVGPLPPAIARLTHLSYLDLSQHNLSAPLGIPDSLAYLSQLSTLRLATCSLNPASVNTGLTGLHALGSLDLNNNPNLVKNDTLPGCLADLPSLSTLMLERNGFTWFPTGFSEEVPALRRIYLSNTSYADTMRLVHTLAELKQCPVLQHLYLTTCSITALPVDFLDLTTLTLLELSNNYNLQPEECLELGLMPSLHTLYIRSCGLSAFPSTLNQSATLRDLYASNNALTIVPPELETIPHLEVLDISGNDIDDLPNWFGDSPMTSLQKLMLDGNGLSVLNNSFSQLVNLTFLSISSNNLGGNWPPNFENLTKLDTLYLQNNQIDVLPDMSSWNHLAVVSVRSNKLHGTLPAFLTNATSQKRYADIGANKFNNIMPGSNYTGTLWLYLDNNRFTFEEVVPLRPADVYGHAPQDTVVDVERTIYSHRCQTATLVAHADTAASLNARFQWFKYIDGVHDSVMCSPSHAARRFTFNLAMHDQGKKFYYKVSHAAYVLVIPSRMQTLIIRTDILPTALGFSTKQYACATNFIPVATYPDGCRTRAYTWTFGDQGTSIEKSPFHAYGATGTFEASMKIRYSCGVCRRDTLVTKPVAFAPATDLLMDSTFTVFTDLREQVLAASAATFAGSWPLQHEAAAVSEEGLANGSEGVWRNDASFVYKVPRQASGPVDTRHDGTFPLEQFNWQMGELNAVPDWIQATTMTEYSPYSYELENRDALGVYTAALYDYGGHLPSANGVNMRHREMAFTSFEFFDGQSSGNWLFGNKQLPQYVDYEVESARSHVAIVKASQAELEGVAKVDVTSRAYIFGWFNILIPINSRYIANNPIVCTLPHPENPDWSIVVLRKEPYPLLWNGKIRVHNKLAPVIKAVTDATVVHAGDSSLRVAGEKTFEQPLLQLQAGKAYLLTAWASVNNPQTLAPKLADGLGIQVVLRDKQGNELLRHNCTPTGKIIEGWQQVRGIFTCPANGTRLALTFQSGQAPQAWFDDLRLHPEEGNMKTYVYDVRDYRLRAILDEENFASFFFYDKEGNLYLTQKETEEGIKTISENVSYMTETH